MSGKKTNEVQLVSVAIAHSVPLMLTRCSALETKLPQSSHRLSLGCPQKKEEKEKKRGGGAESLDFNIPPRERERERERETNIWHTVFTIESIVISYNPHVKVAWHTVFTIESIVVPHVKVA